MGSCGAYEVSISPSHDHVQEGGIRKKRNQESGPKLNNRLEELKEGFDGYTPSLGTKDDATSSRITST
jgi:hypothetical protein